VREDVWHAGRLAFDSVRGPHVSNTDNSGGWCVARRLPFMTLSLDCAISRLARAGMIVLNADGLASTYCVSGAQLDSLAIPAVAVDARA
jgi:hypothetical protein